MKHSADSPPTQESWIPVDTETTSGGGRRAERGPAPARGIPEEPEEPRGRLADLVASVPWRTVAGPIIVAVLMVVGGVVGASLGRSAGVPADVDHSASSSPTFVMDPPIQVGDLVRGEVTESSGPAPANQRIVRADYSDGANKFIFIMTWPEDSASTYVSDAGIENIVEVSAGTLCGTSVDTSLPACGLVSDGTGLLLLAVTEQDTAAVASALRDFEAAVTSAS